MCQVYATLRTGVRKEGRAYCLCSVCGCVRQWRASGVHVERTKPTYIEELVARMGGAAVCEVDSVRERKRAREEKTETLPLMDWDSPRGFDPEITWSSPVSKLAASDGSAKAKSNKQKGTKRKSAVSHSRAAAKESSGTMHIVRACASLARVLHVFPCKRTNV